MHDVVVNELETYLEARSGQTAAKGPSVEFHHHLAACKACREELEAFAEVSEMMADLRPEPITAPQPSPFFFTRVAASINENQNTDRCGLLAPGAAFFRRVAFASLLLLAGLGSYLVTREADPGTDAATIIAQHDATANHAEGSDRDLMLATLASYHE